MNPIMPRLIQSQLLQNDADLLPARLHRIDELTIESQLSIGIEPRLSMVWRVSPQYWNARYSLLVFESTTGFSPELYPRDLTKHGSLIVETRDDSYLQQVPAEGTHYYTFVLYKKAFLGLFERMNVLRFSETVPSAKVVIGRVKDKVELKGMLRQEEVGEIEHEAKLDEAKIRRIHSKRNLEQMDSPPKPNVPPAVKKSAVGKKMDEIDAVVEAAFAARAKWKDIKNDPRLKNLSRKERKALLTRIMEDLDLGEISAENEMEDE